MVKYWFLSSPRPGRAGRTHLFGGIMPDTRFCWPPSVILTREKWERKEEGGGRERGREINQRSNPLPSSNSGGIPIHEVSSTSWSKKTTTIQIFYGLKHRFMLSCGYNNNNAHKKHRAHPTNFPHYLTFGGSTGTVARCEVEGNDLLREQTMKRWLLVLIAVHRGSGTRRQVALIYVKGQRRQRAEGSSADSLKVACCCADKLQLIVSS